MFNDSITLGTLRGIRIGVHWSVLFIASLLAWGLASRILPTAAPGANQALYWLTGTAVAAIFFASLLAHELAHAFFARRAGMRVHGITLWLLGGVAKLEGEVPSPVHDLRIAASGPLVSGLIGVAFWGAAVALEAGAASALVVESALWLARVNLVLAVFNLLPGAPLDGGRIVRAIAWRMGRDRLWAALLATRLGRILGFGLVAFGLFELVAGSDLGGLWTIVLGLFLSGAASAESSQEVARTALDGLRVSDVMTPDPVHVPAGVSVDVFAEGVLASQGQHAALVVEAGGVVMGVAGSAEITTLSPARRRELRVRDIALPMAIVPRVAPDEGLLAAMERTSDEVQAARAAAAWGGAGLPEAPAYRLVVDPAATEGDGIVGLITPADLARVIQGGVATPGAVPARAAR